MKKLLLKNKDCSTSHKKIGWILAEPILIDILRRPTLKDGNFSHNFVWPQRSFKGTYFLEILCMLSKLNMNGNFLFLNLTFCYIYFCSIMKAIF